MNYHASLTGAQTSMKFLIQLCQADCSTESTRSEQRERKTETGREGENSGGAIYSSAWQERDNGGLERLGLMKTSHSRPSHNSSIRELGRGPHSAICWVNTSFLVLTFSRTFDVTCMNQQNNIFLGAIQGSRSSVRSQQTAVDIEDYHLKKHLHLWYTSGCQCW